MVRRKPSGFTLVELLVVLVLLGLMLTLAPIAFQRLVPGIALEAAAREVAATLRAARGDAIRLGRETTVLVDTETGRYGPGERRDVTEDAENGIDAEAALPMQSLASDLGVALTTARSEQLDETRGRIRFYPDGTSTGGEVRLYRSERVESDPGLVVAVDWLSGHVEIRKAETE
ncbi:MAG TPA: GspH/FimT family protein [Kiloniellales bacterium]|nr:GspH/FimT family protein [Kiloniellales bacterium]